MIELMEMVASSAVHLALDPCEACPGSVHGVKGRAGLVGHRTKV